MPTLSCGHTVHDVTQTHYCAYLRLDELTSLQPSPEALRHHDELLFIVEHQATELWFKLILHELAQIIALLDDSRPGSATRLLQRISAVLEMLAAQLAIFNTMAPQDFFAFRGALSPASGAQSRQFHQIVKRSGGKERLGREVDTRAAGCPMHGREELAMSDVGVATPSLRAAFLALLQRRGVTLEELYTPLGQDGQHDDLYALAEALIGYDQQFRLWRRSHLAVAERTLSAGLGGTGGSSGANHLAERIGEGYLFPELWAVRASLWEVQQRRQTA